MSTNTKRSDPTLVFIHGSGDTAAVWDEVIARLPEYSCVALDLPGHGAAASESGPARMTVRDYAESVRTELARRGLSGVCLIGHSLGSAITLRLAADHPDVVARLVLVGGGARLRVLPAMLEEAQRDPEAAKRSLTAVGFAPGHEAAHAAYLNRAAQLAPGMLHRDLAACDGFDMMSDLARIKQPALVITGEKDQLTPPKYALYLGERLPDAHVVLVPSAGHYLPIEAPAAMAEAIDQWLSADAPTTTP
jgi:pimeloyl-ACP methyl ester carboxylesterase